jgi:hypothetical protein
MIPSLQYSHLSSHKYLLLENVQPNLIKRVWWFENMLTICYAPPLKRWSLILLHHPQLL